MRRFRRRRRRLAALVLLPLAVAATTSSIALAASAGAPAAQLAANDRTARYGQRITFEGATPGSANRPVLIAFRGSGQARWAPALRTRSDAAGAYRARLRVRQSGEWRAVPSGGRPSEPELVRVSSRVRLRASRHVLVRRRVRMRGSVGPARPGLAVRIQARRRGGWRTVAGARTRRDGRFSARWSARRAGRFKLRASVRGDRMADPGRGRVRGRINVYRPAVASYYGPGLYGGALACGGRLSPSRIGVAHKTLPCGTKLVLRYRKRTVSARVIDRGPYVGGREFDLTAATKRRLRFPSTGTVLVTR